MGKLESEFQKGLIKDIQKAFKGCVIMKTDPKYIQGVPDLLVLFNDKWALLECKKNSSAKHRPNQDTWVKILNGMSFSKFIYPENKEEVLNELAVFFQQAS
jgi:hypothetical protein